MNDLFAVFLSVFTLIQIWAYGLENRFAGPIIGIMASVLWVIYCLMTDQWGLQILNVGCFIVHGNNIRKWM